MVVGLKGGKQGEIYKMWRRHKLETHGRTEIEVVQVDAGERVQIVSCVGRVLNRCGRSEIHVTSRMVSMRDECKVKSGVQIIVFVWRH